MAMPSVTMDQQYLELMKQLVELQQENIALRKEGLSGQLKHPRLEDWSDLQ